ncbi:hypothetical protein [Conexibacter arvalis]|uniref:IPT/TIG domain-containing protein n=1 Tax=Conexibacter arvalis TaxID=912552 RepID=A0A840IFF9_9ACTN|nr:hypothetical protein [Conexibacter arvalis]MBB4663592.1 hypothetical protein [Conexibacter arvalis]
MNSGTAGRPRTARRLGVAALLAAGALGASAATAAAAPSLTVTPASDLDPAAPNELAVRGTGFTADVIGTRFGVYVAVSAVVGETILTDGASARLFPRFAMPTGAFNATVTANRRFVDGETEVDCRVTECTVRAWLAHDNPTPENTLATHPLAFAAPTEPPVTPPVKPPVTPPTPVAEVSPTSNLNRDGASTITVRGSGFPTGLYVSLTAVVDGQVITDRATARSVHRGGLTPEDLLNADGSFTTSLTINPTFTSGTTTVDCRVTQCAISTWRERTNPTVESLWTSAPISFAPETVPPPPPPNGPQATVTKVKVQLLGRKRVARVGFVTCKVDCAVKAPKAVKVKIGKKRYTAAVIAPKNAKAGKRFQVRVRLTKAGAKALAGRRAKVAVNVKVTADGKTETKKVTATVKAKKAKKVVKKKAAAKKKAATKKQAAAKR